MLKINISTIPHRLQRYDTIGDWFEVERIYPLTKEENFARREIRVSKLGNEDYEFLIALHEMIEQHLCMKRGISANAADVFDRSFLGEGEPGDDPKAPYYKEHQFAIKIERLMAEELGVDVKDFEAVINGEVKAYTQIMDMGKVFMRGEK